MRLGQDRGGLGHEVDTAEDDVLGVVLVSGPAGEVERVALIVGKLDDVLALVVVTYDYRAGTARRAAALSASCTPSRCQYCSGMSFCQ